MFKVGLDAVMPGPKYMTPSRRAEIPRDGSSQQDINVAPVAPSESMLNVGDPTDNCWSNIMQFVSPGDASGLLSVGAAEVLEVASWATGILAETTELLVPVRRLGALGYEAFPPVVATLGLD